MDGTGEGAAPGTVPIAYRYRVRGPVQDPVMAEVRRVHELANEDVAAERKYQEEKDAAWEADPQVTPILAALREAEGAAESAGQALSRAKSRLGYAKRQGNPAAIIAAEDAVRAAKAALALAREAAAAAAAQLDVLPRQVVIPLSHPP